MTHQPASTPQTRRFTQVDAFTATPLLGNQLAVVHDAHGLTNARMQAFARWTNLSETSGAGQVCRSA